MSLIRSDLAVAPSYSRSGKTAASASQQAMGKLKQELETSNRKAARSKKTDTLKDSHKEILSKVLDHSITGVPPSYGNAAVSREQDLCSSPREPSTWKLSSSPSKDSSVKLPRSIDWDLIAEEDVDPELLKAAGPSQEHIRLALAAPNMTVMDELGKKRDAKPSASFLTPGRDSVLSARSTEAPDSGRYEPRLHATQRSSPAVTIADRSLLRSKVTIDERDFLVAQKPKLYQPSPAFEKTTSREKPVVGRIICQVGQAEQRACFGWKNQGQEDVTYDTSTYWEKGGGSIKVKKIPDFSKNLPRTKAESPKKMMLDSQPRIYKRSSHCTWTEKYPGLKTVADLGDVTMLGRQGPQRPEPKRAWDTRQDYRENDKVSSLGEFYDLAIQKPMLNFSRTLPRDKDAAAVRASKLDRGGPDKDYDVDRARGVQQYHVVPFGKLVPRKPAEEMTSFGKESPDVIYHPERSWEAFCAKRSHSPCNFEKTVGRGTFEQGLPESMLLGYPKANKPKSHVPAVDFDKSRGHQPLAQKKDTVDADPAQIMSQTGRATTSLGFAWHPSDCDANKMHIPTPDMAAGGKGRPSVVHRFLDKVYDTGPARKLIDKRISVPNIGQGAAGQGKQLTEYKAERQRLEGEIKSLISTMSLSQSQL